MSPLVFGWASVGFGTAAEIDEALEVMGLEMPVTPDEIRKRYRQLVRELHPDLYPGKEERMKAVNVASERLTGLDPEQLDGSGGGSDGFKIVISFGTAAQVDWIYAAAFSGTGETALLGTYAGRVVRVDREGKPIAIYDVGSVAGPDHGDQGLPLCDDYHAPIRAR